MKYQKGVPIGIKGEINNLAKDAIQVCTFSDNEKAALHCALSALNNIAEISNKNTLSPVK